MLTATESARIEQIRNSRRFRLDDVALLTRIFEANLRGAATDWNLLEIASMELPQWYDHRLDPGSGEYRAQQLRLWRDVTGRNRAYQPEVDEKEVPTPGVDPVRFPGFYFNRSRNSVSFAADHMLASALMLRHSKVEPGSWALEYGAGFGQTALALSRLGVNVDTVDISKQFCAYVKANADFYGTALTPFEGVFGQNPRGPHHKYDLIYFYEAFHHALEFGAMVAGLRDHLSPGGRVILCGEPIHPAHNPFIPYPWGLRLEGEAIAVMRSRGWLELGFTHRFICDLFTRHGFSVQHFPCDLTPLGSLYVFEVTSNGLPDFASISAHPHTVATWHGLEAGGRWSRERSELRIEVPARRENVLFDVANYLPVSKTLTIENAGKAHRFDFKAGESRVLELPNACDPVFVVKTSVHCPNALTDGKLRDDRELGLFFKAIHCR